MGVYDEWNQWDPYSGIYGWNSADPWGYGGGGGNSGQVGFSGGTSGNWWDTATDNGWMYDPYNDEYYRPDNDYSQGNIYPGGGGSTYFTATGTAYDDDPFYYGFNNGGQTGQTPTLGLNQGLTPRQPMPTIGKEQGTDIRTPKPTGDQIGATPIPPASNSTTVNNSTTLNPTVLSATSNSIPGVVSNPPAPDPYDFEPQTLPQSKRMENPRPIQTQPLSPPAGTQTQPKPPMQTQPKPQAAPLNDDSFDVGGGGRMQIQKQPGFQDVLKNNLMNIGGVNRYKKLIDDLRKGKGTASLYDPYL